MAVGKHKEVVTNLERETFLLLGCIFLENSTIHILRLEILFMTSATHLTFYMLISIFQDENIRFWYMKYIYIYLYLLRTFLTASTTTLACGVAMCSHCLE